MLSIPLNPIPLAQSSQVVELPTYELSRFDMLADRPAAAAVVVLVVVLMAVLVGGFYWREARTVSAPKAILLALLRFVALAGLAIMFLGIDRRMNREVVEPSRVVVVADTSLSMALPAGDEVGGGTRAEQVVELVARSPLVDELARLHDVEVMAFDEESRSLLRHSLRADESEEDAENATRTVVDLPDIEDQLQPAGKQSQLGTALAEIIKQYTNSPLAGVVMVTDGGQNTGPNPRPVAAAMNDLGAVLHTVGVGPLELPRNVAVREILAPQRAFPGDDLTITALIQMQGLAGRSFDAMLLRRPAGGDEQANELVDTQPIEVADDEQVVNLRFETRVDEPAKYDFEIRIDPQGDERNLDDNSRVATVDLVERESRVLLMAGAAGRDYRFLRNQLRRDKSFTVDVLLETGSEGVSQDANEVLAEFPASAEELFEYDAIVAFDPKWSALDPARLELLERWVAKQAGGLVLVPGRVNTSAFGSDTLPKVVRDLYPVRMEDNWQTDIDRTATRDQPQRLEFSRAGLEAEFLWLADTGEESFDSWGQFDGVFGAQALGDPKPGATLYAAAVDDVGTSLEGTPYLAGQYFGAGQVFCVGSSETWRLRSVATDYFDIFWTKLLRHVSQGRMLQGSQRARLLVGQDRYQVGETIDIRAVVSDAQLEPLEAESIPVTLIPPSGVPSTLRLVGDERGDGNFVGQVRVKTAGDYQVVLDVPDSDQQVARKVQVTFPQLEVRQVVQNVGLLTELAQAGGGRYYQGIDTAIAGTSETPSLAAAIPSREQSRIVPGAIDVDFARQLSQGLLILVTLALAAEWIIRRLNYLA